MTKKLYPFLSGLHFALLQFGYLLLLQMNFSSTYLTYMIISLAWITGTLIGLWWKNLNPIIALTAGISSYCLIFALIVSNPFSPLILPLSSLGVAITGLWAGRFFIVMLPAFKDVDQLFFLENNGFILGIIAIFLGFTLLGIGFILWAPLGSAAILLLRFKLVDVEQQAVTASLVGEQK